MTTGSQLGQQPHTEDPLRYAFVEMLFALAVSQVAIHAADLLGIQGTFLEKLPGFAHLALGLIVIAASWVGWRQSQSPGMKEQIRSQFSLRFVGLLIDVLLVILYFVLVRSVEIEQEAGATVHASASALPEAFWLMAVFAVYAVWDLIADVFSAGCLPALSLFKLLWKGIRVAVVCAASSLLSLALCYVVYCAARDAVDGIAVALLDAALLIVVLLFRVIKAIENPLSRAMGVTDCKAFSTPRPVQGNELRLAVAFLVLYGALLVTSRG
jgi:hypothetical protein